MTDSLKETTMVVEYLKQWRFGPGPRQPLRPQAQFSEESDRNHNLKNIPTRKYLQWERQTWGINLGWTDDAGSATAKRVTRWFIARKSSDKGPLCYGEMIALGYGTSPSFIRYQKRDVGINLGWSDSPHFEWTLLGGKNGKPVSTEEWLAIFNKKAGDCLIYFDRPAGGDIGWPSSQTWTDQLEGALTKAVKDHWKEAVTLLLAA